MAAKGNWLVCGSLCAPVVRQSPEVSLKLSGMGTESLSVQRLYTRVQCPAMAIQPQKRSQLNLRIEEQDRTLFDKAAEVQRESLTQFLVESGRERAERLLADRTSFTVDSDAWRALDAAMDRPAEVRPELAELFTRARPE